MDDGADPGPAGSDGAEPAGTPFPEDDDRWFAVHLPRLWSRVRRH